MWFMRSPKASSPNGRNTVFARSWFLCLTHSSVTSIPKIEQNKIFWCLTFLYESCLQKRTFPLSLICMHLENPFSHSRKYTVIVLKFAWKSHHDLCIPENIFGFQAGVEGHSESQFSITFESWNGLLLLYRNQKMSSQFWQRLNYIYEWWDISWT